MSDEIIEQMFCLLFWYNNERKWTVQDTVTIIKPRKDAKQYKEGELVCAKFSQKPYKAAIVRLREDKEKLTEDAKKLEKLFDVSLCLTPNQIMEQMEVPVTTLMDEDKGNVMQKTYAAPKEKTCSQKKSSKSKEVNDAQKEYPIQNTQNKSFTTNDHCKEKIPGKSKEISENTPAAKRSKTNKDERPVNKKVRNLLKEEKKNQQVANIEAAKIMAKKIVPDKLFCQDVSLSENVEVRSVPIETSQPFTVSISTSNNVDVEATSSVSVASYGKTTPTTVIQHSRNLAAANLPTVGDHLNDQYRGMSLYNPQPYNSGFSYTNMLNCMNEANSALYGGYPGQEDNICRDPNCHVNCKSNTDAMQQRIEEMQNKIEFLESQLMNGFLEKLAKKVSTSDFSSPSNFNVNTNTPRRPSISSKEFSRTESPAAASNPSNLVQSSPAQYSSKQCSLENLGDISNSTLLHAPQMVELVADTGVMISTSQLNICERKSKESGTALARLLLVVFFDIKTLSESCARGSSSSKRKMLDPNITEAIIQYCLNSKKGKVTEKEIIQAINNKCSDVRQESTKMPKSKKSL